MVNVLFLIGLWACLPTGTEAYNLQSTNVRPIFRCNRILHAATLLRSHDDTFVPEESYIPSADDHAASRRYMQRVAVLLPSSFDTDPDGDVTNNWQHDVVEEEASKHLRQIATQLKLSVISPSDLRSNSLSSSTHILTAVPCPDTGTYAIAIHANPPTLSKKRPREKNKHSKLKLDPFFVDLCPASDTRLGYRMNLNSNKSAGSGNELLLKALGIKKMLSSENNEQQQKLVIYDLTAGLARDSIIMLSSVAGDTEKSLPPIKVHMVERDPLVASLLLDAMRRLDILDSQGSSIAKFISKCLSMEEGDALSVLQRLSDANGTSDLNLVPYPPDIVYLDPMFPPRKKKSSAVKKDMAMLHSLLETATMSEDEERHEESEKARLKEEQQLLKAACHAATRRVVVKRPANALPLGLMGDNQSDVNKNIPTPSFDVRGNINRWDVYCR